MGGGGGLTQRLQEVDYGTKCNGAVTDSGKNMLAGPTRYQY